MKPFILKKGKDKLKYEAQIAAGPAAKNLLKSRFPCGVTGVRVVGGGRGGG